MRHLVIMALRLQGINRSSHCCITVSRLLLSVCAVKAHLMCAQLSCAIWFLMERGTTNYWSRGSSHSLLLDVPRGARQRPRRLSAKHGPKLTSERMTWNACELFLKHGHEEDLWFPLKCKHISVASLHVKAPLA